jgi:hypothetical protein
MGYGELAEQSHTSGRFTADFRPTAGLRGRFATRQRERGLRMKDAAATMAKRPGNQSEPQKSEAHTALHLCYGQIGISAVAAAVRYQGSAKNQAYAPVAVKPE